ncbi:MAG: hypothetical protein GDA54_04965 [Alphaproteobacteria bacterium GM7ARS4]|nr:hypothetical protein [Alphaproteobacteria bacterium GM7ARS4]
MARFVNDIIYNAVDQWRHDCLMKSGSLFWLESAVWTNKNIAALQKNITLQKKGKEKQRKPRPLHEIFGTLSEPLHRLATECVFLYWIYPQTPLYEDKRRRVLEFAALVSPIDLDNQTEHLLKSMHGGVHDPSINYYEDVDEQISVVLAFAQKIKSFDEKKREEVLSNPQQCKHALYDAMKEKMLAMRPALLHLLFPDHYERITSHRHKNLITNAFYSLVQEHPSLPEDTDERILLIRKKLNELFPNKNLDFYYPPLIECWEGDMDSKQIGPVQNLVFKKQLILQGGPGSGKSMLARTIAQTAIRRQLMVSLGASWYFSHQDDVIRLVNERILHISLHRNYGYRDFIRRPHVHDDGNITWHSGLLIRVNHMLEEKRLENLRRIPFIIILDGLQHVSLHDLFGECAYLLTQREHSTRLAGNDNHYLKLASNLYFICTMTATAPEDSTIDINLRRCFVWLSVDFNQKRLINYLKKCWNKFVADGLIPRNRPWESVAEEFYEIAYRGEKLNQLLEKDPLLTSHHQRIGHICYHDLILSCSHHLALHAHSKNLLFDDSGYPMYLMENFWDYVISPMLLHYTNLLDKSHAMPLLQKAKKILLAPRTASKAPSL